MENITTAQILESPPKKADLNSTSPKQADIKSPKKSDFTSTSPKACLTRHRKSHGTDEGKESRDEGHVQDSDCLSNLRERPHSD